MMPVELCVNCKLPLDKDFGKHTKQSQCVAAQAAAIRKLLLLTGRMESCKCGALIYKVTHLNGKTAPYTEAGLNHFIDCPNAGEFRQQNQTEEKS